MFQSTHPHGVRPQRLVNCFPFIGFNPRTRMGCDLDVFAGRYPVVVSIHAPAWGATVGCGTSDADRKFQSTHPHGVRRKELGTLRQKDVFQSTHPHGVRLAPEPHLRSDGVFQSTHPHGVRLRIILKRKYNIDVSIHAPAWGAT